MQSKKLVCVRCLGPGEEHTFLSRDKCKNRVCLACAKAMNQMNLRAVLACRFDTREKKQNAQSDA